MAELVQLSKWGELMALKIYIFKHYRVCTCEHPYIVEQKRSKLSGISGQLVIRPSTYMYLPDITNTI